MKKKSKDDWFRAALHLVENRGVSYLTITHLAKSLGISRSGFYWHFKDRRDMLTQLLKYWAREYTEVISQNPDFLKGTP
jgi:AcrR family transcriptional regulator